MARRIHLKRGLVIGSLVALVSACGMSPGEASDFEYQGVPVMDLEEALGQFETRFQELVKADRGLLTDASACFLSTLSDAATEEVVCGPVVFPGGSLDRVWVRYPAAYEPVMGEGFGGEDEVGQRLVPTDDPPTVGSALGPSERLGNADGAIEDADTLGRLTTVPEFETMGRAFSEDLAESPAPMESMNSSLVLPGSTITLVSSGSDQGYRLDGEPRVAPEGSEFLFLEMEWTGEPQSLVKRIEIADSEPRPFTMPQPGMVRAMVVPTDSQPELVVSDGTREQRLDLRSGQARNGAIEPREYSMGTPLQGQFQPVSLCVDEFAGDERCEQRRDVVYSGTLDISDAVRVSNIALAAPLLPDGAAQVVARYDQWAPSGSDFVVLPIPDSAVSFQPQPSPQGVEVSYGFDAVLTSGNTTIENTTIESGEFEGVIMVFQPPSEMEDLELQVSMRLSWTQGDAEGSVPLEEPLSAPLR